MRPHVDAETMPGIFICHAIFYKIYKPIGGGTHIYIYAMSNERRDADDRSSAS